MATATPALTPKRIEAAAKTYAIPRVPADIHKGLLQRWNLRCTGAGGESFKQFFLESVLRRYLAEDPLEKLIEAKSTALAGREEIGDDKPPEITSRYRGVGQDVKVKVKIVIGLLKKTPVDIVAKNFGFGASTIRRVQKKYMPKSMPSAETIQQIVNGNDGVEAMAERHHLSVIFVEAILQNYRPLVRESCAYGHKPGGFYARKGT